MAENKKYYVTLFGANAVGKSSTTGWLANQGLPENGITCATAGKYAKRNGRKYYTGGADSLHSKQRGKSMTDQERQELIQELWASDADVVIGQGMMLSGRKELKYYKQYKKEIKDRQIIVIHLYADIEELGNRVTQRSGGKEFTKLRRDRIMSRLKSSRKIIDECKEDPELNIYEFDVTDPNKYTEIRQKLLEVLGCSK